MWKVLRADEMLDIFRSIELAHKSLFAVLSDRAGKREESGDRHATYDVKDVERMSGWRAYVR